MDITRRRLASLTVTLTLLSLPRVVDRQPESGPIRASTHPFVAEFYSNQSPFDGVPSRTDASAAAPGPLGNRSLLTDYFGNEVDAAVATYTVDPIGTLYEEHSPQTELPRLDEPRS